MSAQSTPILQQSAEIVCDRSAARLHLLRQRLTAAGCTLAIDPAGERLVVSLDAEESSWLRTGYLTALLLSFDDVVRWRPAQWNRPAVPPPAPLAPLGLIA